MLWIIRWMAVLLLATQCRAQRGREGLRSQVAMLREEQWRDRERIEALERRLSTREERDSPTSVAPEGILEFLEDLLAEVSELSDELKKKKWVEEAVVSLQAKQEEEVIALRQLMKRVDVIEEEQRNLSQLIFSDVRNTRTESQPTTVSTINPWSEEGSGDLIDESLFPAGHSKDPVKVPESHHKVEESVATGHKTSKNRLQCFLEKDWLVQRQTQLIQERCIDVVSNATDDMRSSMALLDNLQDDLNSLRMRVGKVDFNTAQSQAELDVLKHDWIEDRRSINNLQNGSSTMKQELNDLSRRLLVLEMQTANMTLQRCREDGETYKSRLMIQNIDLRITQIDRRIDESMKLIENNRKSNENALWNYRDALANMARRTHNMSGEILLLTNAQTNLQQDMDKFVKHLPKDCSLQTESGIILIEVPSLGPMEVYCDTTPDGGPWMMVQKRFNGSESFFRDWTEYKNGFGQLSSEFWIGNEALHLLTDKRPMKLHVDMWDIQDNYLYVDYEKFRVRSEMDQYAIEISNHSGNASDALTSHNRMGFSTFDRDNDASSANCAVHHTGGWWYQHCHRADLNGRYSLGMTWYDEFRQEWLQLVRVEIKIAPVDS
ncbi:protein scabrous [Trichonephila inaurata madagascariensis]|uniref:Protein scabrous n=1 Tax=Trichonephila inaurata madagascariensis TaxID=2747483 RepID=A0A8X6IBT5_9ARAC|nr:protein scabrous [Trichonephila inaurata madagascariensis]